MSGQTLSYIWLAASAISLAAAAYFSIKEAPDWVWSPIRSLRGQVSVYLAGLFLCLAGLNNAVEHSDLGMIVVNSFGGGLCLGFVLFLAWTGQPLQKLQHQGEGKRQP